MNSSRSPSHLPLKARAQKTSHIAVNRSQKVRPAEPRKLLQTIILSFKTSLRESDPDPLKHHLCSRKCRISRKQIPPHPQWLGRVPIWPQSYSRLAVCMSAASLMRLWTFASKCFHVGRIKRPRISNLRCPANLSVSTSLPLGH